MDTNLSTMYKWDTAKLNDVTLDVITKLDYGEMDKKKLQMLYIQLLKNKNKALKSEKVSN